MLTHKQPAAHFGSMAAPSLSPNMATLGTTNGTVHNTLLSDSQPSQQRHIWIIGGPAGTGKSTVAKHIADSTGMPYIEGDEVRQAGINGTGY
jgi:hypothetical protein